MTYRIFVKEPGKPWNIIDEKKSLEKAEIVIEQYETYANKENHDLRFKIEDEKFVVYDRHSKVTTNESIENGVSISSTSSSTSTSTSSMANAFEEEEYTGPDLFEYPENLPQEIQDILNKYSEEEGMEKLDELLEELKPHGYTFDYGLDAVPYDLRKINQTENNNMGKNPVFDELLGKVDFMEKSDAKTLHSDIQAAINSDKINASEWSQIEDAYKKKFGSHLSIDAKSDYILSNTHEGEYCLDLSKSEKRALSIIVADKMRNTSSDDKDYPLIEQLFDKITEAKKK